MDVFLSFVTLDHLRPQNYCIADIQAERVLMEAEVEETEAAEELEVSQM